MTAAVDAPPRVSVVVPCYEAAPFIEKCLGSLLAQTLSPELFEVLLVFNGPDDGGADIARRLLTHSSLRWSTLESVLGAGEARNHGVARAEADWVTFVDADDQISANYLELLLASATDPLVVPVAGIVDVDESGVEVTSPIQEQVLSAPQQAAGPEIASVLAMVVLKLLPTEVARRHPFDPSLRSGEDVALFASMAGQEELSFDTTPARLGAVYRRLVRPGSVGRQGDSYDFMVDQRLDVIKVLETQVSTGGHMASLLRTFMGSQAKFVASYLQAHPDEQSRVISAIRERGFVHFPWNTLRLRSNRLFVADRYAPFSHVAAIGAAKAVLATGELWNVITAPHPDEPRDTGLHQLNFESVSKLRVLPDTAGDPLASNPLEDLCHGAWHQYLELEKTGLTEVYTWGAAHWAHLLGALVKTRHGLPWRAEIVDPCSFELTDSGHTALAPGWLADELDKALEDAGQVPLAPESSLSHWVLSLAAALADEVVFSNSHQLVAACRGMADGRLRERLERRATTAPERILSGEWYRRGIPMAPKEPGVSHLAHFGDYNGGLGEVLQALGELSPAEAARVRVHLFSATQEELASALAGNSNRARVTAYAQLPYLRYLQAVAHFDTVLVADHDTLSTGKLVNVSVPWQWPDLVGSGTAVWKIVEPGSILSRADTAWTSQLGDPSSSREVLRQLAAAVSSS